MRIGYLTSQYPATSHTFIRREVEALRARGIDIACFSIRRPIPAELTAESDKRAFEDTFYVLPPAFATLVGGHALEVFRHPARYLATLKLALRHRAPGMKSLIWALFHFLEAIHLARELRRRGITHLHNHFANAGANVGLLASCFLSLPWSLTLHGISETDYPAGLLLAEKIAHAKFVACVSWFGRAQAMRITPRDQWSKFLTVRCGVRLAEVDAIHQPPKAEGKGKRIICVGRLSIEKAHPGLFEAFANLIRDLPDSRLVLVGDGPDRQMLEDHAKRLGISESIEFLGRKTEAETLIEIAKSDMLVVSSFMEGLPVVLMEAMALRVPVVASHVAGIPELLEDGRQGLLFRPADWTDLHRAMGHMLMDPVMRDGFVKAAREKIEAEFDIDVAVEPLFQIFSRN